MNRRQGEEGFTLVELVVSVALFTIVLGATAQALISYYTALDLQNQRHTALRTCTSIISQMREVRDANGENFPNAITAEWPDGAEVQGVAVLPRETVTVQYADPNANPLQVTVRSEWVDHHGRPVSLGVSTVLTNE